MELDDIITYRERGDDEELGSGRRGDLVSAASRNKLSDLFAQSIDFIAGSALVAAVSADLRELP
jgi:hypothetical protein